MLHHATRFPSLATTLVAVLVTASVLTLSACAPVSPTGGGEEGDATDNTQLNPDPDSGQTNPVTDPVDEPVNEPGDNAPPPDPTDGPPDDGSVNEPAAPVCPVQALFPVTDGCTLTLRTPANCATISLSAEMAWEGDACHTPYYLQITGSPPSEDNYNDNYIDAYVNAPSWAEPLSQEHIDGLVSVDGWYHWRVCNAYESGCSGSRAFRLE